MFFGAKGALKAAKETTLIAPSLIFRKTTSWCGRIWLVGGLHIDVLYFSSHLGIEISISERSSGCHCGRVAQKW